MSCMNKFIPRIALLLLAAECVLVLLSWLLEATQTDGVRSLLSSEGLRWYFGQYVAVLLKPQLIWLLLLSGAFGTLWMSGLVDYRASNYRRHFAIRASLLVLVLLLLGLLLLAFLPSGLLLSSTGRLWPSPFSRSLVFLLTIIITLASATFGLLFRTFTKPIDVFNAFSWGLAQCAPLFVLYLLATHLYESLCYVFL